MNGFTESLKEAEKNLKTVDHMIYVTFPLIKDKRLLLKILIGIKGVVINCVNAILQYEYLYKRIRLFKDSGENFSTFSEKSAPRYGINKDELRKIQELFNFVDRHKESPFEFMRGEKLIILSEGMRTTTLSLEKAKEFLSLAKEVLKKTKTGMHQNLDTSEKGIKS